MSERGWIYAIAWRSVAIGTGVAIIATAGSVLVLGGGTPAASGEPVLIATVIATFAIGLWAGAAESSSRPRERWLTAAAMTAVGGAYATFAELYQALLPGSFWQVGSLILAVGVPCYAIGLLPPAILSWIDTDEGNEENDREPRSGLNWLVGGVLFSAAGAVLFAGLFLVARMSPASMLMLTSGILILPFLKPDPSRSASIESTVYETTTPFGSLRVTQIDFKGGRQPERRLYLNGEQESGELVRSGVPTLAYVAAAELWIADSSASGASYLLLGGGAYTLPRRIFERDATAKITVVELDPEVTRIAQKFFGLKPHHRIESVHGDARAFLDVASDTRFDRIYIDVYGGLELLPHSLVTREAVIRLRERLKPNGMVAANLIGTIVGEAVIQPMSVVATFAEIFPSIVLYTHLGPDYPERQNLLLIAANDAGINFPSSIGTFERWPSEAWPQPDGVTVFRDLLPVRDEAALRLASAKRTRDPHPPTDDTSALEQAG